MQGDNYRIEVSAKGIAEAHVWKRPDLSVDQGAGQAATFFGLLESLARARRARGFLVDLADAPLAFGPQTEASMTAAFRLLEELRTPLAVIVSDSPIQRLQLDRVVRAGTPTKGRLFRQRSAAETWLSEALGA